MPQRRRLLLFAGMLVVLLAGIVFCWQLFRLRPTLYSRFHVRIPQEYSCVGIDVSRYQGKIFWNEVRQMRDSGIGISFVFIKATEGCTIADKCFADNWSRAASNGMMKGAYHYFHPALSATEQAAFFSTKLHCKQVT